MENMQGESFVAGVRMVDCEIIVAGSRDRMLIMIDIWLLGIAECQGIWLRIGLRDSKSQVVDCVLIDGLKYCIKRIDSSLCEDCIRKLDAHALADGGIMIYSGELRSQAVYKPCGIGFVGELQIKDFVI